MVQDWSRHIMWLTVPQLKVTLVKYCKSLFLFFTSCWERFLLLLQKKGNIFLLIETYGELWNAINNELLVDILSYTLQKYLKDDNHKNFHLVQKHTCIITCPCMDTVCFLKFKVHFLEHVNVHGQIWKHICMPNEGLIV